jgi:uncharacterized membrane protein
VRVLLEGLEGPKGLDVIEASRWGGLAGKRAGRRSVAPRNNRPMPRPHRVTHFKRLRRILSARPRLWSSVAVGALLYALLPAALAQAGSRALLAWNAGALLYLGLAAHMLLQSDTEAMQRRAQQQSEGRAAMLVMVVVAAVAVLLAVGSQLIVVKALPGSERAPHLALAALTVLTSWLFTQTLLAFNYAHDFYRARDQGQPDPLTFPGTVEPSYGDFFYFACVIGTSGQTADVVFNGAALRPVGTLHCILAFFFNTTVLALTVNIAAGLF